jgi:hypothetical protein
MTKELPLIEHFWPNIHGQFTFPDFYRHVSDELSRIDRETRSVEVGVNAGQSAAFLAVELANKCHWTPRLDLVDRFEGGDPVELGRFGPILDRVLCKAWHGDSARASQHYDDESLDFVFLDADHAYESVAADIEAWHPKVRVGGILAGHDFTHEFPGVIRAVCERFRIVEVWRGSRWAGGHIDESGTYFPVWCVRKFGESG